MADTILSRYQEFVGKDLSIDATRGKPSEEQVALSKCLLDPLDVQEIDAYRAKTGIDILNYGGSDGLPEMKSICASILGVLPENVIIGGNASLNMMYDAISTMVLSGLWMQGKTKILCPSPGYDRHFAICEYLGLEMITIPMTETGPDMDMVEEYVKDQQVAGIWCVPIFSNPQGYVYSNETVTRLAKMQTCENFKILWDNAYAVHHFKGNMVEQLNILKECEKYNNPNRPVMFTSFSKISYPGAGVVCMAASKECLEIFRKRINVQTIGPDKINQYRHIKCFKNLDDILRHMEKHAQIMRPKFELVDNMFSQYLPNAGARFAVPNGGYFVSVETPSGKAKKVVEACKKAGVLITSAGATFPYGKDEHDSNLRFAPSFLTMDELEQAAEIFCLAVALA